MKFPLNTYWLVNLFPRVLGIQEGVYPNFSPQHQPEINFILGVFWSQMVNYFCKT